ncbi:MAG: molybdopterin-dependent oxidoreductase [Leptospiraceae bacterium]|nr:molybdopterin-dependent oxidoreductase [Leptospiraceae bacterium]
MAITKTIYRACNLCEATCGLRFEFNDDNSISVKGDKEDPFSRGHLCAKGPEMLSIYNDPDRLKFPMKRTGDSWKQISWVEALSETATKLHEIQKKYGNDSVGIYLGNPNVHNYGSILFGPKFFGKLKTKNLFVATSVDQLPHHLTSHFLYRNHFLIPIPDIERTKYFLILGGNPFASNGSMMTAPDIKKRLKEIQERGGKVVTIDPRKTETADFASDHIFIKPGTDIYFLLSMIHILFKENLIKNNHVLQLTKSIDELKSIAENFPPEDTENITGIKSEITYKITREFAKSESGVCYGRMGLSTQEFGTSCQWATNIINILTGNLDSPGGSMFTNPAADITNDKGSLDIFDRYRSRIRNLPEYNGEFPVAIMADEILTPGQGQIKTLITSAGNPVLSTPNGTKLDKALSELEFMVSIDFYLNETTRNANIILPPTSALEHDHYDLVFNVFAVRNNAKYSIPVFDPPEGTLHDWQILSDLAKRMDLLNKGKPLPDTVVESKIKPTDFLNHWLTAGTYGKSHELNVKKLEENPHGIDLGPLQKNLPEKLRTEDKKINLVPEPIAKDFDRILKRKIELIGNNSDQLLLIGRRHLRNNNSWMHNIPKLMTGKNRCTILIHPEDAKKLNISNEENILVKSNKGEIQIEAEISDKIMQGVVSIPHGFGHNKKGIKLSTAGKFAGVSINDLTDEERIDEVSGNAAFSGTPVSIKKL